MRKISGWEAIAEATEQAMEADPKLFVMGEGADDPKGIFGTTKSVYDRFGAERVFDTPLSESAVTGIGIGAALEGHPCLMVHARSEFLLLAIDQVVNHAAKWRYMSGGALSVPIVIRCIVGRGWGQAAQHSQTFHSLYSYFPGLKVVLPSTPYESKGLLYAALQDPNPVVFIEHRWLHNKEGHVPERPYSLPLGRANVVVEGKDVTCVGLSYQIYEALEARERLLKEGIEMEVIDLRCVRPLDRVTILKSVAKTGRLIATDIGHEQFGVSAEVAALVSEDGFEFLKAPIKRLALPDAPTPCSPKLEAAYYPSVESMIQTARELVHGKQKNKETPSELITEVPFSGPF